jgi:hypothetical protein
MDLTFCVKGKYRWKIWRRFWVVRLGKKWRRWKESGCGAGVGAWEWKIEILSLTFSLIQPSLRTPTERMRAKRNKRHIPASATTRDPTYTRQHHHWTACLCNGVWCCERVTGKVKVCEWDYCENEWEWRRGVLRNVRRRYQSDRKLRYRLTPWLPGRTRSYQNKSRFTPPLQRCRNPQTHSPHQQVPLVSPRPRPFRLTDQSLRPTHRHWTHPDWRLRLLIDIAKSVPTRRHHCRVARACTAR